MRLQPCPFCGGFDLDLLVVDGPVLCLNEHCLAEGPVGGWVAWGRRRPETALEVGMSWLLTKVSELWAWKVRHFRR